MAEVSTLEALQAFHQEILSLCEGRVESAEVLERDDLVQTLEKEIGRIWERPPPCDASSNTVKSGKIVVDGEDFSINEEFQQAALALADQIHLDQVESAKCLLEALPDTSILGRSLIECAIIRHHQQRKYALDILRLFLEFEQLEDDFEEPAFLEPLKLYVQERIFQSKQRLATRCLKSMEEIRNWLSRVSDRLAASSTLGTSDELERWEFSRISLLQQHELLGVILCQAIEQRQASVEDFKELMKTLRKADKYDASLLHLMPSVGAFISAFGSTEGGCDLVQVRRHDQELFPSQAESTWPIFQMQAAIRSWWLAEYSGFYLDDPPEAAIPPNTDLDEEDRQRSKQFLEALKDGAFDFLLAIAGDVRSPDWHDPVRAGVRKWLQRKSPPLPTDTIQFSDFFQKALMLQFEVFVDAFISNLPDVLRKLRVDEDEQRQLSQAHEQDLDLERFLLIIAYAYEDRPNAAMAFWSDPDSNLAGFLHWASRRASTPLVTAFCEMLQAISENDDCATAAHEFLLDEASHSSGKLRKSQALTWARIFRELDFFSDKIRAKPVQPQTVRFRTGKPSNEQVESEPESAMMLECYLRLIGKLSSKSETTRQFLLQHPTYNMVETLFELASSPIPSRLRGCIFIAFKSLMSRKNTREAQVMWTCVDSWLTGGYASTTAGPTRTQQQSPTAFMDRILLDMSVGYDDPVAFVEFLLSLLLPASDSSSLNDGLPFPETLGSSYRMPGIEVYIDYVVGSVFATKANDLQDVNQARGLRLACIEFILTGLSTFNEDLIIMANETNLPIDSIIATTDLATYVRIHPFARIMEWMFNDKVMIALFNTISQDPAEVGNASPDSPLILGILRAVEVVSKVLDLQATYLELVRPIIKMHSGQRRQPVANPAYASFEDGLVSRMNLVVDLGNYCGMGHPDLTLACLKLLEKVSSSTKITTSWSGVGNKHHRNKAIIAMEANGEYEAISRAFISDLAAPLDLTREADAPNYITKIYILDFLYSCLQQMPNKPTIAHLLLGFKCGLDTVSIEGNSPFESQTSLFHTLLKVLLETPCNDSNGMRRWLVTLKARVMRVLHILWSSPLSAPIVIEELRENQFLFLLLIRELVIQPELPWEGNEVVAIEFPVTDGAVALLDFISLRGMTLEYIATELCLIAQGRLPGVKRRIYEALNGQVVGDANEPIQTPTVFDLYDFLIPTGVWDIALPPLQFFKNLDLSVCIETDSESNSVYNTERVREMLTLKRTEQQEPGALISPQDLAAIDREQDMIVEYLVSQNRQKQLRTQCLKVLQRWARLLLIMIESSDLKGTSETSFFLQAIQAILPSLEAFATERPEEALELAKIAKVLLYKFDLRDSGADEKDGKAIGNLIGDKLYQIFEVCLQAIGKWAGNAALRSVYYEICYRYLIAMADDGPLASSRAKTIKTIHVFGERLINVICDDAYGSEPSCQTSALVLLNALINVGHMESDNHVVETLNKLNFIGILVDSLRNVMREWHEVHRTGQSDQINYEDARLSLLLQLAQTRSGAKYMLHSNLFRAVETSGLFAADPELQLSESNPRSLCQHYDLLAKVIRIVGAALISRGSHNVVQGRRFLADHRLLVMHTLKRSAGIGRAEGKADAELDHFIEEAAEGLMVIISATNFVEFENEGTSQTRDQPPQQGLFH